MIKRFILAVAAASFMLFPAFAADGVVKEYNAETHVLMLEDSTSFTIPTDLAVPPEVKLGAKVTIEMDKSDSTKVSSVLVNP
ncbi:hypothetical protein EDC40_102157 [Aminobacter aminovorans]|uniref:DUF1344 domain-containing protein n=1 Tax=Aminobacter aminovorans TaxID=83263 RepID=A0A380WK82_AMIAI|nr:hypothetical protein EDC40_102157 [Aminobacter aminovorans]SUU88574.1 Uncharacterised protein [Aminobacter aminovorans]